MLKAIIKTIRTTYSCATGNQEHRYYDFSVRGKSDVLYLAVDHKRGNYQPHYIVIGEEDLVYEKFGGFKTLKVSGALDIANKSDSIVIELVFTKAILTANLRPTTAKPAIMGPDVKCKWCKIWDVCMLDGTELEFQYTY